MKPGRVNNPRMKAVIAVLAATLSLSAGLGPAGIGVAISAAQATSGSPGFHGPVPAKPRGPYQWCPGQSLPEGDVAWNMNVCHTWYWVDYGFQANRGQFVYEGDNPPADLGCIPGLCLPGL